MTTGDAAGGEAARDFTETLRLVEGAKRGDRSALERLFSRYYPRVERIVALRMGKRLGAFVDHEDLAQETLMRVFQSLGEFEPRSDGSFRNWLAVCVERAIQDSARRMKAKKRGSGDVRRFGDCPTDVFLSRILAGAGPTPSVVVAGREEEERLESSLLELPAHQRELVVLRHFCGMSHQEIADTLGITSESTVRKSLARVVAKLTEALGGSPGDPRLS